MPRDRRIRQFLIELNTCRRLWRSWNNNLPDRDDPPPRGHPVIKYKYLIDQFLFSHFFRLIVRLYALMEEGDDRFSFGTWLASLEQTPVVQEVHRKYEEILASPDFATLRERRHNFFAHNALDPRETQHTIRAVFGMSEALEDLYDEVVADGQADPLVWEGEIDPHFVHPTNCPGGIEVNTDEFFTDLMRGQPPSEPTS